jgi:glycosyltransferase involved in cell wall biosynthesis
MINISIIIPHLLDDDWLRVTIKLLQESSPEISREIIVVDSGREVPINLDGYGDNIKILHYKRIVGVAEGRMIGAANAVGEVLIFSDSHCLINSRALGIIYPLAKKEGLVTVPCRGIGYGPNSFGGRGGKFTIPKDKPWVDNIWGTGPPQEGIKVNLLGAFYIFSREMFKTVYFNPVTIGWGGGEIFPSLRMASLGLGSYLTLKVIVEHVFKRNMPLNYLNLEKPYSIDWNIYSASLIHFPSKREYFLENIKSEMRVAFEKYEIEWKDIIQKEIDIVRSTRTISEEDLWYKIIAPQAVQKQVSKEIDITDKKFEIIKATYGPKDVTSIVKSKCEGDSFIIFANNATFGDPTPEVRKTLNVTYSLDGVVKEVAAQEKDTLRFRVMGKSPCNCGSTKLVVNKMQIVVAGWYFWPEFLKSLSQQKEYGVQVVAHKLGDTFGMPLTVIDNIGLEFHCYDYYIKHIWNKKDDVLFMHDDVVLKDISILDEIANLNQPITMIWRDEKQQRQNYAHGRCFKCSAQWLLQANGFWYDKENTGQTSQKEGGNKAIEKLYQSTRNITKHFFTDKIIMASRGKEKNV